MNRRGQSHRPPQLPSAKGSPTTPAFSDVFDMLNAIDTPAAIHARKIFETVSVETAQTSNDFKTICQAIILAELTLGMQPIAGEQNIKALEAVRRTVETAHKIHMNYLGVELPDDILRQVNEKIDLVMDALDTLEGKTITKEHLDRIRQALEGTHDEA